MGLWTTQGRCPQAPQAQQQQKKRTFDVLQTADIFTRYGQKLLAIKFCAGGQRDACQCKTSAAADIGKPGRA
jgi:hypothetical protein